MSQVGDWKKVQVAIQNGLVRSESVKAGPQQVLTYILSVKKLFHHATLESAKAEKEFLEAALGREMKIYKVWNAERTAIEADMAIVRESLSKTTNWQEVEQAMDRVLQGAGY